MRGKILVAVDLSPLSTKVVGWATELACARDFALILLHVQECCLESLPGEMHHLTGMEINPELRRRLESYRPEDSPLDCQCQLKVGPAAREIVDVARKEKVDLVVIGSRARTGLARLLLGSVAEFVLRRAACPVIVIKEQPADGAPPR